MNLNILETKVICSNPDNPFHNYFAWPSVARLQDGRLMMLVRTFYGIGVSYSFDRGKTWSEGKNSGLPLPV